MKKLVSWGMQHKICIFSTDQGSAIFFLVHLWNLTSSIPIEQFSITHVPLLLNFIYSNMIGVEWNEENVRFLHTQNMDPFTNIGIDFEILSGKELYINEESRVSKFTLFGSSSRPGYSAFGTFHFNRFNNRENGGLQNPDSFLEDNLEDKWLYPVKLNNASSGYNRMQLFYTQKFTVSEKRTFTDSLGVKTDSGKNFFFNHQLMAEQNKRYYEDQMLLTQMPDFYNNFYYYQDNVKDSAVFDKISNVFQIVLGDPYTDKLSARVYAGHEFSRYGQVSPDEYQVFSHFDTTGYTPLVLDSVFKDTAAAVMNNRFFNELFVGFHMAGPPNNLWYWNIDAKYYLAGYYRNNFIANATFSRQVFRLTDLDCGKYREQKCELLPQPLLFCVLSMGK